MAHGQPPLQSMWLTEDEGQTSSGRRFGSFLHAGLRGAPSCVSRGLRGRAHVEHPVEDTTSDFKSAQAPCRLWR